MVLHVGYHKTGTSWLQDVVFPSIETVSMPLSFREVLEGLVLPHAFTFEPSSFRDRFGDRLERAGSKGAVSVISNERLSGSPHAGGHDAKLIAERLHRVFPDGRVVLVIREQTRMIASCYKEYVRGGGTCSFDRYIDPPEAKHRPMFDPDFFRYDRCVRQYYGLFGADRVKVLPFEWLRVDPVRYLRELTAFIGVDVELDEISRRPVRKSLTEQSTRIKRWTNRVTRRTSLNPCTSVRIRGAHPVVVRALEFLDPFFRQVLSQESFRDRAVREFDGYYGSSNRRLEELVGIELERLDYDLA